jgi:hypothetical protein
MSGAVQLNSLAPILIVETIAPCLPFWEAIGFSATVTVPDAPPFGFAIVARNGIEVMLQTRDSVESDMAGVAERVIAGALYLSVANLDAVISALGNAPVIVPRRKTFYGADEIFVLDPAGNVIGFAAHS